MGARRPIGIFCGLVAAIWIVLPALAVPLSAIVDRGPDGPPRLTAFHLALALSDDSAVEMVRNSAILATIVSALAMALGVGLGRLAAGPRYLGREILLALTRAPRSYPPMIAAVGMIGVFQLFTADHASMWGWIALGWVELAWAVPRVMAASSAAFTAVDASWIDAARLAGAKKSRARGRLGWPLARNPVARSVAEVFAFTLFEPGAPLILGMRRTLPVGLIEAALGLDREARAAVLATIGLGLAFGARGLILAWGGPPRPMPSAKAASNQSSLAGSWAILPLTTWATVALLPIAGLAAMALGLDRAGRFRLDGLLASVSDHGAIGVLRDSLLLGLGATAFAGLLAWGLNPARGRWWLDPASWPATLPPLAFGLGVFLVPGLLDAVAALAGTRGGWISSGTRSLADLFDPYRSPWLVLVAATAVLRVPALRAAIAEARAGDDRDALDAARTLGASRWRAWVTTAAPAVSAILAAALSVSIARAALDAAPALLLSRTMSARPVAVAIVGLAHEPGGPRRAAVLALAALILPVFAWVVAGARRGQRVST